MNDCCLQGFRWDGVPRGEISRLGENEAYVTGTNAKKAVMIVHDIYGWTFTNTRLLADHYAAEADVTVYVPDFFGGENLDSSILSQTDRRDWAKLNLPDFLARNSKEIRTPELVACAKTLRSMYHKVGVIGFCWGGWAVFRLGAKAHNGLVDCISTAHPSMLDKEEMVNVDIPVQILAPEHDDMFTPDLKEYANKVIPALGVAYDYQHFPGISHAFAIRGDPSIPGEREGMQRAKDAAILWFRQWLDD